MVYYHTSSNVKLLRNILNDYGAAKEITPHEYMKNYIQECPENADETKITWIVKTFLDIHKQGQFLQNLANHLSEKLHEEEREYFLIIFHALVFRISPKNMKQLYKCMFNLSKPLLGSIIKFLCSNDVLNFISKVAHSYYDTNYVTEKIIGPLFTWQPYLIEMGQNFDYYERKMELKKIKPNTVPIQPNVLNRNFVKKSSNVLENYIPITPPKSLKVKEKKMLTKNAIDQRLLKTHEENKKRAAHLLINAQNVHKKYNFAQGKSDKYYNKVSTIREERNIATTKNFQKTRNKFVKTRNTLPIKQTTTTLKRMNKRVQITEQDEIQWLSDLMNSCKIIGRVEELIEYDRQESKKERLYDMERKHLEGLISYEEAIIAKRRIIEENRKKRQEFFKEKEKWDEEIENWKKNEMEKNRKQIEHHTLMELNLRHAKLKSIVEKKTLADQMKKESELSKARLMKQKQDELEKRAKMIKEIKIYAMIAKRAKVPKLIDLTETSGARLLCEMSLAELHERLNAMKIGLQDELKRKQEFIKEKKLAEKLSLEDAERSIETFITERAMANKNKEKPNIVLDNVAVRKIDRLKNILEEKKRLRVQLAAATT